MIDVCELHSVTNLQTAMGPLKIGLWSTFLWQFVPFPADYKTKLPWSVSNGLVSILVELNPIENLQDQLINRIEAHHPAPLNLDELRAALCEEWTVISEQYINYLVNSVRHHCQTLIDSGGHLTCN